MDQSNQNIIPLEIKRVGQLVASIQLVGIGESTHGTHEFFITKMALFQELVKVHDFNTLMFEDGVEQCAAINTYIQSGKGNIYVLVQKLYSVWRTQEFLDLIQWMRGNYTKYPTTLVGFDVNQSALDMSKRDEYMAENVRAYIKQHPQTKALIWAHNYHLSTIEIDGAEPMGLFLHKWFGEDYFSIAQFFGRGRFSATHVDERHPNSPDRTLKPVSVDNIPKDFLEGALDKLANKPYFLSVTHLTTKQYDLDKIHRVRSIGWGLVPGKVNNYADTYDVTDAYDGLIYFPQSLPSAPLV